MRSSNVSSRYEGRKGGMHKIPSSVRANKRMIKTGTADQFTATELHEQQEKDDKKWRDLISIVDKDGEKVTFANFESAINKYLTNCK